MSLARTVACSMLLKTLENEAEIVRSIRNVIAASLEDDIRIEELQELYKSGVSRMLVQAKAQQELAELTESELIMSKASAVVAQIEAVYKLVS